MGFILAGSTLDQDRVVPVPFRIARETKQAASGEAACPVLLPLLDELRTYCYGHQIEKVSALLVG